MVHDPRIGESHTNPVSSSRPGAPAGRGAGGHCLIKDFEAFRKMYKELLPEATANEVLLSMVKMNVDLLTTSQKDLDLLKGVYGDSIEVKD